MKKLLLLLPLFLIGCSSQYSIPAGVNLNQYSHVYMPMLSPSDVSLKETVTQSSISKVDKHLTMLFQEGGLKVLKSTDIETFPAEEFSRVLTLKYKYEDNGGISSFSLTLYDWTNKEVFTSYAEDSLGGNNTERTLNAAKLAFAHFAKNYEYNPALTEIKKQQQKLISQQRQIERLEQQQRIMGNKLSIVEILQNPESYTYRDDNIEVTLDKIYVKDDCLYAEITLMVIRDTVIIRPQTCKREVHPDGRIIEGIPQGIEMLDNFDNSLGLGNIEPCYYGDDSEIGIRPKQSQLFTIRFNNKPLNNTGFLVFKASVGIFGNSKPIQFTIPRTVIINILS